MVPQMQMFAFGCDKPQLLNQAKNAYKEVKIVLIDSIRVNKCYWITQHKAGQKRKSQKFSLNRKLLPPSYIIQLAGTTDDHFSFFLMKKNV